MRTEEEAQDYLYNLIFLIKTFFCSICGSKMVKNGKKIPRVKCRWKNCGLVESIFKKSFFEGSRCTLLQKLNILYLLTLNVPHKTISEQMNMEERKLRKVIRKINYFIIKNYYNYLEQIGGEGVIVEVDESKFGKQKYGRGHSVKGIWVVGMVERTSERKIILLPVVKRERETLTRCLCTSVKAGSIIYSDMWRGYNDLQNFYIHSTVNHSVSFVDPITKVHTNTIEGNWSAIKRYIPSAYKTKKRVWLYLLLFMLKRNSKNLFQDLIKHMFL